MDTFLNPAQTVTDLRKAVEVLNANVWDQGQDYREDTRAFCAFGAVRYAIGGLVLDPERKCGFRSMDNPSLVGVRYGVESPEVAQALVLRDRASNAARAFYRVIGTEMSQYNDVEGRTKDQMIRALETVASSIEEDPRRA